MVDTHAHLSVCKPGSAELVAAAAEAGVTRILDIGLDEESNRAAIAAAQEHPGVFASVGRHPNAAEGFGDEAAADLAELARNDLVRAVGETGLDWFRKGAPAEDQRRAFAAQIDVAKEVGLPLVIHVRDPDQKTDAVDEVFDTLDERGGGLDVILHCFSAPWRAADAAERGWYCSFAGNVTYPSAGDLRDAAAVVPADRILVETDSPFLSPQPVRGKPNQPANVVETAAVVAAARGVSAQELKALVEANAARLFGW